MRDGGRTLRGMASIATFHSAFRRLESRLTGERMRLGEGVRLSGSRILTGAARDGVYAVNLKRIARGNWRNNGCDWLKL